MQNINTSFTGYFILIILIHVTYTSIIFMSKHYPVDDLGVDAYFMLLLQGGETPLFRSAMYGQLDVVQYLVKVGCDIEAKAKVMLTDVLVSLQF